VLADAELGTATSADNDLSSVTSSAVAAGMLAAVATSPSASRRPSPAEDDATRKMTTVKATAPPKMVDARPLLLVDGCGLHTGSSGSELVLDRRKTTDICTRAKN